MKSADIEIILNEVPNAVFDYRPGTSKWTVRVVVTGMKNGRFFVNKVCDDGTVLGGHLGRWEGVLSRTLVRMVAETPEAYVAIRAIEIEEHEKARAAERARFEAEDAAREANIEATKDHDAVITGLAAALNVPAECVHIEWDGDVTIRLDGVTAAKMAGVK